MRGSRKHFIISFVTNCTTVYGHWQLHMLSQKWCLVWYLLSCSSTEVNHLMHNSIRPTIKAIVVVASRSNYGRRHCHLRCVDEFPLRPAFAMTINKAQGQMLQCVGVLLDEPVFTHGQLYVASSRCGDPQNIIFSVDNRTANVVYTEVLSPK